MDVLGNIMGRKSKLSTFDKNKYFGDIPHKSNNPLHNYSSKLDSSPQINKMIRRDNYAKNFRADQSFTPLPELTHSQAMDKVKQVAQGLSTGYNVDAATLQQVAPYMRIGAQQITRDKSGNPISMRITRATGYQGPADPVPTSTSGNQTTVEKYTIINYPDNTNKDTKTDTKTTDKTVDTKPDGFYNFTDPKTGKTVIGTGSVFYRPGINDWYYNPAPLTSNTSKPAMDIPNRDAKGNIVSYTDSITGVTTKIPPAPVTPINPAIFNTTINSPTITDFTTPKSNYIIPNTTSNIPVSNVSKIIASEVPKTPTTYASSSNAFTNLLMPTKEVGQTRWNNFTSWLGLK